MLKKEGGQSKFGSIVLRYEKLLINLTTVGKDARFFEMVTKR